MVPPKLPWQLQYPAAAQDSFGRTRTSAPKTFFNSDFEFDTNPLWFVSSIVGTGSVAKTSGESSLTLSTGGTASGAGVVYQTKQYFRYEPGKGRFLVFSGYIGAQTNNVRSRMGNFDSNNGVFFEIDGTLGASVNQRSNTSGSVVDTKIAQTNWNVDKFDGTGVSGVTLDFSKTQLMWIDYQWMGTGHTRWGFFVNGYMMACHEVYNDNTIVSPYTNTACLPMRAEIFNTGIVASASTLKWVCCSLVNEGSPEIAPSYISFRADNGINFSPISSTLTPILSIQPKLMFAGIANRVHMMLDKLGVAALGGSNIFYQLVYNGTLTGASFQSVDPNSCINFDTSATSISGGTIVLSGYATSLSQMIEESLEKVVLPFTLDYNGVNPDTWTLVCQATPASTNATCTATLTSALWNAVSIELKGGVAVGGAHNAESAGATTLSVTYSPTMGNAAIIMFNSGAVTGLVVKDNLGNTLSAGPTSGTLASFYQFPVPAGVTSYVATWTTARQAGIAVEEYSGVSSINAALPGNTASATSATASITTAMERPTYTLVVGLGSTNILTGTVGNVRQSIASGATSLLLLMDNTVVAGQSNVSGKISWIELR